MESEIDNIECLEFNKIVPVYSNCEVVNKLDHCWLDSRNPEVAVRSQKQIHYFVPSKAIVKFMHKIPNYSSTNYEIGRQTLDD